MKKRVWTLILIPFLLFYALPAGAVEKEERKWQDESIYFLMVDRFSNENIKNDYEVDVSNPESYHGGDFQGIINRLDYIEEMGFTTILLSPIFKNQSGGYHGYWITDFYDTEEHFGTLEEFKQLVAEAHKRDIKVMLDFVVNNSGTEHEFTKDPQKADWYHEQKNITDSSSPSELEQGWVNGLPDFNQNNPEVRDYLIDAAKWWITETDIDGYRLDAVKHVPKSFWTEFSSEVKSVKENFYLLGDIPAEDANAIAEYNDTGIDGFADYPLQPHLRAAFAQQDQSVQALFDAWENSENLYGNPYLSGTFLDNHHTIRFTRDMLQHNQHPGPRWRMALSYLYTMPGVPIVYYGSEIALDGGETPDNRKQLDFRTDKELIEYITKLSQVRNQLPSLTRGDFELLYEKDGMAIYKRTYEEETSIVALNNTSVTQTVTLTADQVERDKELRGLLTGDVVRSNDEGEYTIVIDREETEAYVLTEKTGLNFAYMGALAGVLTAFAAFLIAVTRRSKRRKQE